MTNFGLLKVYPPPSMANSSTTTNHIPPPPSNTTTTTIIKQEQEQDQQPPATTSSFTVENEPKEEIPNTPEVQKTTPDFMNSVNELFTLSTLIQSFKLKYDDLTNHLDFIQQSIDSFSKTLIPPISKKPPVSQENPILQESPISEKTSISKEITKLPLTISNGDKSNTNEKEKQMSSKSELENLCETMCGKGLRRYIVQRLSDVSKLREKVPKALKLSPKPSKLVLDCIGKFFLQGSKAYTKKNSHMVSGRRASVLALEFFLLSDKVGVEFEGSSDVKKEAEVAAIAWRKRLVAEGGISSASQTDARGLLMFVACFGIPIVFSNEDIRGLILGSNPKEISNALRKSYFLMSRIKDIIDGMMKNGMFVQACNVTYTFGVEEKYRPQNILSSFLQESKDEWKRKKEEAQGSPIKLKEANQMQLAALKSVVECLEYHKVDPSKLLPGWQVKENITRLEKTIVEVGDNLEDKAMQKRKANEMESSQKLKTEDLKRSRSSVRVSPQIYHSVTGLPEQRAAGRVDAHTSYDQSYMRNNGSSGYVSSYYGTIAGGGSSLLGSGIGAGVSTGLGGSLYTSRVREEILSDKVGQMMNQSGQSYGWTGVGNAAYNERLVRQNLAGKSTAIEGDGMFGPSPSYAGFPGLPNPQSTSGISNRSSGSDLYRFADSIPEVGSSYYSSLSQNANIVSPTPHAPYYYRN